MAVVASTSMRQVMEHLGYGGSGGAWTAAKAQILELGLDTSHFTLRRPRRLAPLPKEKRLRNRAWTDEQLARAVRESTSVAGVIRALGVKVGGSVYVMINERIAELGLDTSHFRGQGWNRGQQVTCWSGRPLAEILVRNSDYRTTSSLRKRLIKEGLKEDRCEICVLHEWCGRPLVLQLDHINGDRTDNRLENLRILCPNCHSQTETWCGRNIGRARNSATIEAQASVVELADTTVSRIVAERREGSNPSRGTRPALQLTFGDLDSLD